MNEEMLFAREDQVIDLSKGTDDTVDFQKFLIFIADDLKLGVVAESVVEILTNQTITYLPRVPEFIRGIINMRGQIIPILDVRLRLGKPSEDNSCGIVVDVEGNMVGILVDMVEQMVDVPLDAILPVPTSRGQAMVCGMCTLPDGNTMLELDCGLLLQD